MIRQRAAAIRVCGLHFLVVACFFLCAASGTWAQLPVLESFNKSADAEGKIPEYDVASVKVNKANDGSMRMMMKPDGYAVVNLSLANLIANAYGVRNDQISGGPGWVSKTGFDVEAKVAGADVEQYKKLSAAQRRLMMQALLADRFKLKIHKETKEMPIYELTVAKGGVKMTEAAPPAPVAPPEGTPPGTPPVRRMGGRMMMGPGRLEVEDTTVPNLAANLAGLLQKTVIDKTGLTASYTAKLCWTPDNAQPSTDAGADAPPSIFTAVQEQLGLRLQPARGPVDTVVIDSVEQPSEN